MLDLNANDCIAKCFVNAAPAFCVSCPVRYNFICRTFVVYTLHPFPPILRSIELKSIALSVAIASLALPLVAGSALASEELAKQKACLACHQVATKVLGPSYKDIAAKYKGDKDAEKKLAVKIRAGGTGVWGQIPMPPNAAVNEAEAATLAKWILAM